MSKGEKEINERALARRAKVKNPAKRGFTVIDIKYCKGCGLCIDACPTGALQYREAPTNKWGVAVVVDSPDHCTGCGLCETHCPDFSIFAYKNEELKDKVV